MSKEDCLKCSREGTGFCKTCKVRSDLCCGDDYFCPKSKQPNSFGEFTKLSEREKFYWLRNQPTKGGNDGH